MIKRMMKKAAVFLLAICFCVPVSFAAGKDRYTISVTIPMSGIAYSEAECSLYYVASAEDGIAWLPQYEDYHINTNTEYLPSAAFTLASYIDRDNIEPDMQANADADGTVRFSGLEKEGLYLVCGEPFSYNQKRYTPDPMLVLVPAWDGAWDYDVAVEMKSDVETIPPSSQTDTKTVKVFKTWTGPETENSRPDSINVQLLMDGDVYRTAALDSRNNWSHIWHGLPSGHRWSVVEDDIPAGYQTIVKTDGSSFAVINEWTETSDTPDPLDPPSIPENPGMPEEPGMPTQPALPGEEGEDDSLPQTGYNRELPLLGACAGSMILAFGLWLGRKGGKDHL